MEQNIFVTTFTSYYPLEIIGEGGSGRVFKVKNEAGEIFALKCLSSQANTEKRRRFKNELFFCVRNTHKNIITVIDHGIVEIKKNLYPFYVMPWYPSTLRNKMNSGLPNNKVLEYFSQIIDGVDAAHKKSIWHRDLKPENILYDPSSNNLVIADFGIAHFGEEYLQTSVMTKPQERLANFLYAAPEQRVSGKAIDQRADIYALGLILNEMFTGQVLQGTNFVTITSVAPEYGYVDQIVEGMVCQTPEERYSSIEVVKNKLIAYGNEFVSKQKISRLTGEIIRTSDIDDLLVADPVRLLNVDFKNGTLYFQLNHYVNSKWQNAFRSIGNYTYYSGFRPDVFQFSENMATITAHDPDQRDVDLFKDYVSKANADYERLIREEQKAREEAERRRLRQEVEDEMKRQEILKKLRI